MQGRREAIMSVAIYSARYKWEGISLIYPRNAAFEKKGRRGGVEVGAGGGGERR